LIVSLPHFLSPSKIHLNFGQNKNGKSEKRSGHTFVETEKSFVSRTSFDIKSGEHKRKLEKRSAFHLKSEHFSTALSFSHVSSLDNKMSFKFFVAARSL
jgi:hypothetical protein